MAKKQNKNVRKTHSMLYTGSIKKNKLTTLIDISRRLVVVRIWNG